MAYAFEGTCDASKPHAHAAHEAIENAAMYAGNTVTRWTAENGELSGDVLDAAALRAWIDGCDPITGAARGRRDMSEKSNLLFDSTINTPKSFSVAAMLNPELAVEFESLQERLRDRVVTKWQTELNARRGATDNRVMESLARVEVVELVHARSRSLDPHAHRHLWLNAKVQGADGKWSNVDSAVMMKFQPIVNGEGELAARTDPAWLAALARNGMTVNDQGEISELAHLVRPMSRRSNQIEANRAALLADWQDTHPGEPTAHDLAAIDSRAWAMNRPNKPGSLDELSWAEQVRDEIAALDPALTKKLTEGKLAPVQLDRATIGELDRGLLAAEATAWADARSARSNDRFSHFDLRAGAAYVVAASGVMAERAAMDELLEDVTARAVASHTVSLSDAEWVPAHVKSFRSTATVQIKHDLEVELANLSYDGPEILAETIKAIAADVSPSTPLDAGQFHAAQIIAGHAGLVTITGPAGTGKTTILKVVKRSLDDQGRRLLVVAPSKKAANVAGEAIAGDSSSVHALIRAYGWRWATTTTGEHWTRLQPGDVDPSTGAIYGGVPAEFMLRPGDRIVVDEAGMMDLYTARAVAQVASTTGAGIAMVGDHLQLSPVGHSGAMALAHRLSHATTELSAVHRFRTAEGTADLEYAALSLRLREPEDTADAESIAAALSERGQIVLVADDKAAQGALVDRWFEATRSGQSVAITTSTNEEAQTINDEIQRLRIEQGELDVGRATFGQHSQRILVGDRIQTRLNDRKNGVANRDDWVIVKVNRDGSVRAERQGDLGNDVVSIDAEYLAANAHLSYASTAHGIQGTTVDVAITGPGVTGAGLYVGMTRGKRANEVVSTASSSDKARAELAEAIMRGRVENTLEESRRAVAHEISVAAKPAPSTTADWTDYTRRPFGRELDLATKLAKARKLEAYAALAISDPDSLTTDDDRAENLRAIDDLAKRRATIAELEREIAARESMPTADLVRENAERQATVLRNRSTTVARRSPHPGSSGPVTTQETNNGPTIGM